MAAVKEEAAASATAAMPAFAGADDARQTTAPSIPVPAVERPVCCWCVCVVVCGLEECACGAAAATSTDDDDDDDVVIAESFILGAHTIRTQDLFEMEPPKQTGGKEDDERRPKWRKGGGRGGEKGGEGGSRTIWA
jgi:hypothetical protein